MSDDKQSGPKEEASTSVQPEKVLLDLNLPALPANEDAKEVDTPKSRSKKKKPKRVHFPSLTKEKRTEMWREEKRRTRAKLTPEVQFARHKHDREVKKEKFKNAKPEEQKAILARLSRNRIKHRQNARARLQAERAARGIKSSRSSKYDP